MANESFDFSQSINSVIKNLTELGSIEVNFVVNSFETLKPLAGAAASTANDVVGAAACFLGSAASTIAGAATSAGNTVLNTAGAIISTPLKLIGGASCCSGNAAPAKTA